MTRLTILFFICCASLNVFLQASTGETGIRLKNISKSLLMPSLMILVLINGRSHDFFLFILLALFLSWLGDLFLISDENHFFLMGLTSFLLAHVAYIYIFFSMISLKTIPYQLFAFLPIILWYSILLFRALDLKKPFSYGVSLYMLTIGLMVFSAILLFYTDFSLKGLMIFMGAVLFASSDSVLSFNVFKGKSKYLSLYVMMSYISAQWLIVMGLLFN